jgi:transcriptional regulator with XRE-family HTH domain
MMTLQQVFIKNLKKRRKEHGISQIKLSEMCDTTSNYIGQIEMGRRIPSFDKIEKIAAALGIASFELFSQDIERKDIEKQSAKDYLMKMPADIKKEIISNLLKEIKNNIHVSFDFQNY